MVDQDTTKDKIVVNRIVTLKESRGARLLKGQAGGSNPKERHKQKKDKSKFVKGNTAAVEKARSSGAV